MERDEEISTSLERAIDGLLKRRNEILDTALGAQLILMRDAKIDLSTLCLVERFKSSEPGRIEFRWELKDSLKLCHVCGIELNPSVGSEKGGAT